MGPGMNLKCELDDLQSINLKLNLDNDKVIYQLLIAQPTQIF